MFFALKSAAAPFSTLWRHRLLAFQMIQREVLLRYKNSVIGMAWSVLQPLVMLSVYTFVFTVVYKARWGGDLAEPNKTDFALLLFVGLIIHSFFFGSDESLSLIDC